MSNLTTIQNTESDTDYFYIDHFTFANNNFYNN